MGDSNITQKFCCTCLKAYAGKDKLISVNHVPTKSISYKFKLQACVPEMVLDNADDSLLCDSCLTALETAYTFRCMCLRNEGKLAEFRRRCNKSTERKARSKNIKIKQEMVESYDVLNEDNTIYFTDVAEVSTNLDVTLTRSKSKRISLKEPEVDPLEGLGPSTVCSSDRIENEIILEGIASNSEAVLVHVDNEGRIDKETNSEPIESFHVDNDKKNKRSTIPPVSSKKAKVITSTSEVKKIVDALPNTLNDLEIIENACKTIPELLAYGCDIESLNCKVSLERVKITGDTVILPSKKYFKHKFNKKHKKKHKSKKDINYWCHICVKFIAIGRRHRYTAHMLNHKNIKSYKCDKCTKEFTYAETLSKHKKECTGVLTAPQILPNIKIKTENNTKFIQKLDIDTTPKQTFETDNNSKVMSKSFIKSEFRKIKKEPYDVDNDWTFGSKTRKYIKLNNSSDLETRRSLRAKPVNKQVSNLSSDAYHCEICEYQSYKKHQYQVHMMKHFNDRRFECTKCPKRFFENWELNRHLRTVHLSTVLNKRPPPNSYDIQNIKPLIAQQSNNIDDSTSDNTNDIESTAFAKILEPAVSLTVNHETVVTPIIQSIESLADDICENGAISFACKVCNLTFQSHSSLMIHSKTHKIKSEPVVENDDNSEYFGSYSNNYNLMEMVETHIPPKLPPKKKKKKKFFCTICNLEFASKDHGNIHTGAKPYDCKVCGKDFAAYSTLRKHRWTHLDEPRTNNIDEEYEQPEILPQRVKHACNICNKTFMNKWQVNSHTCHSASGETVYRCQICKNVFVGRTALIEHMGVHVNQSGDFFNN